MKWAYSIQQKFKAAALLGVVCVIVLITALMGKHNIDRLGNSFSSVFNDRLVVESYIYRISDHLYQKKLASDHFSELGLAHYQSEVEKHNQAIAELLEYYDKTYLTEEEEMHLKKFKGNIVSIQALEDRYLHSDENMQVMKAEFDRSFSLALSNLRNLSNIQIKEGQVLTDQSQRIVYGATLLTNFEIVILICIALMLQVIVAASKPLVSRTWQKGRLN